jgi:hypothetical protein
VNNPFPNAKPAEGCEVLRNPYFKDGEPMAREKIEIINSFIQTNKNIIYKILDTKKKKQIIYNLKMTK